MMNNVKAKKMDTKEQEGKREIEKERERETCEVYFKLRTKGCISTRVR